MCRSLLLGGLFFIVFLFMPKSVSAVDCSTDEISGGTCRTSCESLETVISVSACGESEVCCKNMAGDSSSSSGSGSSSSSGSSSGSGSSSSSSGGYRTVPCPGGTIRGGICFPTTGLSSASVYAILQGLLNWLLAIVGFISIIAFVISGMQYLLSAGNDDMIETAKRNMTWSIVGVVVALSGYVIILAISNLLQGSLFTFF